MKPTFELLGACPVTGARAGVLRTARAEIPTPIFMPVGTVGSVKAVEQATLEALDFPIILGNTYHLYLRPGEATLARAGGLHRFMGWPRALLTDSGGFQVYSLPKQVKLDEQGVTFTSHINGDQLRFTPESVVDFQRVIGSDIQMVLDECPPHPSPKEYVRQSIALTHRWAARARARFLATEPHYGQPDLQFGIVQGGVFSDLRADSAKAIADLDFDGNAIGGLSVGESEEELYATTELTTNFLPPEKPRYLMGVGTPANLLECIARGVDMFDCVLPTRNARHGKLYGWDGERNLPAAKWKHDFTPLWQNGPLPSLERYTRAYVRHLFNADEYLALMLTSANNLAFYRELVRTAREKILAGSFAQWLSGALESIRRKH